MNQETISPTIDRLADQKYEFARWIPTVCYDCGCMCSGDTTIFVEGLGDIVICDDPDKCPANQE